MNDFAVDYADGVSGSVCKELKDLNVKSFKVMTHPAIAEEELKAISSYTDKRTKELKVLTTIKVPKWAII